jgi:hypothetical protein
MPFAATVERFGPPALAVVVPADENVPSLRTSPTVEVGVASARKSTGNVEGVVDVAGTPMLSKVWVYVVLVETDIAAYIQHAPIINAIARPAAAETQRASVT